jgi:hypothetical protein
MKGYPIQTLLFWRTQDAIKVRKFMDDIIDDPDLSSFYDKVASEKGKIKVCVLDGQQRLQSLFAAYDGTFDGRDLYINLLDGESEIVNGLSYRFEKATASPGVGFFRVKSLSTDRHNAEEIAEAFNQSLVPLLTETPDQKTKRERTVRRNLSQLYSIFHDDKHLWVEELDGVSSDAFPYGVVLNIFIRVNSGGTKLESADLMFAVMKESWAEIEEDVETLVGNLNKSGKIFFDKDFALKCLMVAADKGAALFPEEFLGDIGDKNLADLKGIWTRAEQAFKQLTDFVYNDLKLYSDKVIRSYNAFVPIFEFFFRNPSPTPSDIDSLKSYYYRSQLFNWYSRGTDAIIDGVHGVLGTNVTATNTAFPLSQVKTFFASQGRQIDLVLGDLDDARLRFIILNIVYVEQLGVSPFNVSFKGNDPHIDHIYPKSKLKSLPSNEANHIGNYRFIGASENLRKRAEDPDLYFSRLKASGVNIACHLLVSSYSTTPSTLTYPSYSNFRGLRTREVFKICSNVVNK